MKKNVILILTFVLAVAIFAGVYYLYNSLRSDYAPPELQETEERGELEDADEESEPSGDKETSDYNRVPDFTVFDESGKAVRLSEYFGKPLVVNFWATWCHYCKEEMPSFHKAYAEYPKVEFLMINATDRETETMEKARAYVEDMGYDFPVLYDLEQSAAMTYGVRSLPVTFFIDKNGCLVTYAIGMIDYETLEKGIGMILEDE